MREAQFQLASREKSLCKKLLNNVTSNPRFVNFKGRYSWIQEPKQFFQDLVLDYFSMSRLCFLLHSLQSQEGIRGAGLGSSRLTSLSIEGDCFFPLGPADGPT